MNSRPNLDSQSNPSIPIDGNLLREMEAQIQRERESGICGFCLFAGDIGNPHVEHPIG
jgi:hypothetical protein